MANPDDKKISQLPDNPVIFDNDIFSSITPRTDNTPGYENVKTKAIQIKGYVNTDPHFQGTAIVPSGDRAHPSIAHENDTDTGIFFPATDTMALGTAGVESLTLDPRNNVIIGPTDKVRTDSSDGFLYVPTMDGSPTVWPRNIPNKTPLVVDDVNGVAWVFIANQWRPIATGGTTAPLPPVVTPPPRTRLDALDDVQVTGANVPLNNDALSWDATARAWRPKAGGVAITIRPDLVTNYPNPATLPVGHVIYTTANANKEVAVVDATHRIQVIYSDTELATKIAASSLFQGVKPDLAGIAALPTPAPTNRGFYWTWTGPASTPITPADFPNGGGFNATLQVGDWIQSDGTRFVHVPSDLMSKLRWKAVGSFQNWADQNWEVDSLVVFGGKYYRATRNITLGDPDPATGGGWVDITPQTTLSSLTDITGAVGATTGDILQWDGVTNRWVVQHNLLENLTDVDDNVSNSTSDAILVWDSNARQWTNSRSIEVDAIEFPSSGPGATLEGFAQGTIDEVLTPADEGNWTLSIAALREFVTNRVNLEQLADTKQLAGATDGQVPAWSVANNRWEPVTPTTTHPFLGAFATRPTAVNVGDTYYQTVAQTVTTTTPGTTAAGIVVPTPTYDPRMNVPLAAGAVPDPADPGNPWRNPAVVALPSTEPKYRFIYNGVTYQVDGAASLALRINGGQATPDLWAQGANPPVTATTGTAGTTTTTNIAAGFYSWDGTVWNAIGAGKLSDLTDVNLVPPPSDTDFLSWDAATNRWLPRHHKFIGVFPIQPPGILDDVYFQSVRIPPGAPVVGVPGTPAVEIGFYKNDGTAWQPMQNGKLSNHVDTAALANATDKQVPVYNATNQQWEPKTLSTPIIYLGQGAWTAANVGDPTQRYGMPAGTVPDPQTWPPAAGDQYIDLSTGMVTAFTGPGGVTRVITGGTAVIDFVPTRLAELQDVYDTPAATANQYLVYDGTQWGPVTPPFDTVASVDAKISTVVTGLAHDVAVQGIATAPPAAPVVDEFWIVAASATGAWAGQVGKVARWDGAAWQFSTPQAKEAHLVEDQSAIYSWNGTTWVKVASGTSAPAAAAELWGIGDVKQSILTELQFTQAYGLDESAKWVLADGRSVVGSKYATITGNNNVPDLRGAFFRAAGQNATNATWNGGTLNTYHEDTTRRPRNTAFTTDNQGSHNHLDGAYTTSSQNKYGLVSNGTSGVVLGNTGTAFSQQNTYTSTQGPHHHTIDGGGDAETAPRHYSLNVFIKIN